MIRQSRVSACLPEFNDTPITMRGTRALVVIVFALMAYAADASAQATSAPPGPDVAVIRGEVTTQSGTIVLGAVQVTLLDGTREVAHTTSEGDGTFRFENVKPGRYNISTVLDGFQNKTVEVAASGGEIAQVRIDLQLGSSEQVEVKPIEAVVPPVGTLAAGDTVRTREVEEITGGGGVSSALRLLASVIEVPGGVAIKGGRPSQSATQIGPSMFVDPATGLTLGTLPDDAIDTVTVLANPYSVEYGRFSSGLVVIETRRGSDKWRTRLSNLEPAFRTRRGSAFAIVGLSQFNPRFEVGGPLVKDKLFIQQSFQYRYRANDVASRPQDEVRVQQRFSSFTRLDANVSKRHSLVALVGVLPSRVDSANLGTFTPPPATVNTENGVDTVGVTDRAVWTDTLFSETTIDVNRSDGEVFPKGSLDMTLLPETTLGNFFNHQHRNTSTFQVLHTLSGTKNTRIGLQMFKFGGDLLYSMFDGTSESRSVLVRESGGTLTRRLDYNPSTTQQINSTDVALFAQDRLQPNGRFFLEFGARLDRDGVIDRYNVTPRAGAAILLNQSGTAVIRSGYGLFFERTPSAAGVFEHYESALETRYGPDGETPLGPPVLFRHLSAPDLETSRSATWDIAYDHRLNRTVALHIGALDRRGSHELLVEPITSDTGAELLLHSDGRSQYRELELGVHLTGRSGLDLNASYVRSQGRADLNAFTLYFDQILSPVIGQNQYAPARADAPDRLLVRGRMNPARDWLVVGVMDWHTGLPYSVVDGSLDYVGARNSERFPTYFRLDAGVDHRFKIGKFRPWLGVRVDNALNSFLPADVQANNTSPLFGTFYNSEYRQYRIQVRFER